MYPSLQQPDQEQEQHQSNDGDGGLSVQTPPLSPTSEGGAASSAMQRGSGLKKMLSSRVKLGKAISEEELALATLRNRDNFPDPTVGIAPLKFLRGMTYAFVGMKKVFTEGYAILALFQAIFIVPLFILWVAASAASGYGVVMLLAMLTGMPSGTAKDGADPQQYIVTVAGFSFIVALFFLIVYGFLVFKPLLTAALEREARRMSYMVELRMNGFRFRVRDFLCGQPGAPGHKLCSAAWWKQLIKDLFNNLVRTIILSIVRQLKQFLSFALMHVIASVAALIPVVGPWLSFLLHACLLSMGIAFLFFDMVLLRKKYSVVQEFRTLWNNMSLVAGVGFGFLLMLPLLLFLFPAAIIACTRLYVHLVSHGRAGHQQTWFDLAFVYGVEFQGGLKVTKRSELLSRPLADTAALVGEEQDTAQGQEQTADETTSLLGGIIAAEQSSYDAPVDDQQEQGHSTTPGDGGDGVDDSA